MNSAPDPADEEGNDYTACLKTCSERQITYTTSISETDVKALDDLVEFSGNATQNFSNADITILQLYFSTFEYPIYHLTEVRWYDFFGKK